MKPGAAFLLLVIASGCSSPSAIQDAPQVIPAIQSGRSVSATSPRVQAVRPVTVSSHSKRLRKHPPPTESIPPAPTESGHSYARDLATLDRADDQTSMNRYQSLLDQMTSTFSLSERQVSDYTVQCQNLLRGKGIDERLLSLMEGFNQATTSGCKVTLPELAAAYATMRNRGFAREDALGALRLVAADKAVLPGH